MDAAAEKFANKELNWFAMSAIEPLLEKSLTVANGVVVVATELTVMMIPPLGIIQMRREQAPCHSKKSRKFN